MYRQALIWIGCITSPMQPVLGTISQAAFFAVFYKVIMQAYVPPAEAWGDAKATKAFSILLLLTLGISLVPSTMFLKEAPTCGPHKNSFYFVDSENDMKPVKYSRDQAFRLDPEKTSKGGYTFYNAYNEDWEKSDCVAKCRLREMTPPDGWTDARPWPGTCKYGENEKATCIRVKVYPRGDKWCTGRVSVPDEIKPGMKKCGDATVPPMPVFGALMQWIDPENKRKDGAPDWLKNSLGAAVSFVTSTEILAVILALVFMGAFIRGIKIERMKKGSKELVKQMIQESAHRKHLEEELASVHDKVKSSQSGGRSRALSTGGA